MTRPVCPCCGYVFTCWRSLRHWNPYYTTCPQCGAKLRVRQATVFFVLSALCGLLVAVVAIFCEETRIWDASDSLKFFAVAIPLIVVPWSIFLWSRSQYILRTSSMKPWSAAITGFVIGAAIALFGVQVIWMRTLRAAGLSGLRSMEHTQEMTCLVSLVALDKLEKGDQDDAKSFLACKITDYYQHPIGSPDSPHRKEILPRIEVLRTKSTALDKELSKKPQ